MVLRKQDLSDSEVTKPYQSWIKNKWGFLSGIF